MSTVGPLWKTTIIVWGVQDPQYQTASTVVSDPSNSILIESTLIYKPECDLDWDETDLFGDPKPEEGEPGGACGVCRGRGGEWVQDQEDGELLVGDTCEHCQNTKIEPLPAQETVDYKDLYEEADRLGEQAKELLAELKRREADKAFYRKAIKVL